MANKEPTDSEMHTLIQNRITQILPTAIQQSIDWEQLMDMRNSQSDETIIRQIDARLASLIDSVTSTACPDWFIAFLQDQTNLPESLQKVFRNKARGLLRALEW